MSSIKTPDFNAPAGFKEILHDFALEVLRYQPEDVIEFAADYFENLLGVAFFFLQLIYMYIINNNREDRWKMFKNIRKFYP